MKRHMEKITTFLNRYFNHKRFKVLIVIVLLYMVSYIGWAYIFGHIYYSEYFLLVFENRIINIITTFGMNLALIFCLSGSITLIAIKIFKMKNQFKAIVFLLITLSTVSIIIMVTQMLFWFSLRHTNGDILYIKYLGWCGYCVQTILLFIGLKEIFKATFFRILSILTYSCIIFLLFAGFVYNIGEDIFFNDYKAVEEHYFSQMQFKKNITTYKKAIEKHPNKAKYHYFLGETYRNYINFRLPLTERMVFWNKAEKEYEKALSINPEFLNAKIGLGCIYIKKQQYQKALIILKSIDSKIFKNDFVNIKLGEVYLKLNNNKKALEHFGKGYSYSQSENLNKLFVFSTTTKQIELMNNEMVIITSDLDCKIEEPLYYLNQFGSIETAEKIIGDLYNTSLKSILIKYSSTNVYDSIYKIEQTIIHTLNDRILKNSGVKVINLKISIRENNC